MEAWSWWMTCVMTTTPPTLVIDVAMMDRPKGKNWQNTLETSNVIKNGDVTLINKLYSQLAELNANICGVTGKNL